MMKRICSVIYLWATVYCNQTDLILALSTLTAFTRIVCVPAGTCTVPSNNNVIDIRIVTQGNTNPCPRGQSPCAVTVGANQCGLRFATNISNVDGFASPGAFPWQVYLVNQTGYTGSGVLINEYHVLTAAHKVYLNGASPEVIGVFLGVHHPQQLSVRYSVQRVLLHPNFNPTTLFNDIAILRLSIPVAPLPQTLVNSVCLPSQYQIFEGQLITNTCYTSMSRDFVLGVNNAKRYLDPIGELCAGGQGSRDACVHDGGAPLTCEVNGRFYVAGLVLWGKGCGLPGIYGVYANVTHYVNWISSAMAY
ncbi:hypothetical protein RI129_000006 [Pyrocoelia pectoralis]|uniref:Peptidase S1 domain-containing protein n=1 Tax=Pyrocoelia pectoralis TaxID=417401 RepID=A0AAN7V1W6_9COLE